MNPETNLQFQIERLARRLRPLQARANRVAIARLVIVLVAIAAALFAAFVLNSTAGWLVAALGVAIFVGIAIYHQRLDHWIETLSVWRALKTDRLARLTLDWDNLPAPRPIELRDRALALDLDLTGYRSLHQLLDTTISRHGTQLLADWLTAGRPDLGAITARQNIVRELRPRARFRDRFRLTYRLVLKRELEGDNLLAWLKTEFSAVRLRWALPVATFLVAVNILLFVLSTFYRLPPFYFASLAVYVAFYYWNQSTLDAVLGAVVRVNTELEKFSALVKYLERASYHEAPHLAALCAPFLHQAPTPSQQLSRVGLVTAGVGLRSNPLIAVLLNLVLPWDFLFAFLADRQRARVAQSLPEWVRVVHELDALIALANFAALNPTAAFPEIRAGVQPVLETVAIGHPMLALRSRVTNDLTIDTLGQVELLTGSNMAGKSTFLKTIGINFCLAYAGAPVLATKFVAQPFRLHCCIRITDSIVDGFSYFYAEVKCLKALLERIREDGQDPLFYLVDEIFRGTNNRERLIGSRAYIQALLGANGVGLVATHDLELAHLADNNPLAHNYHFRDRVQDGKLIFDYQLHPGPSPTTNALKIMALEGLPISADDA